MNSLLLVVASNVAVACCIAVVAYGVGRWGKSAALTHLLWVAVFIKLITPPIVIAPVTVPSGWDSSLATVYRALVIVAEEPIASVDTSQATLVPAEFDASSRTKPPHRILNSMRHITLARCLVAIWLIGMVLIFVRGVVRFAQFSRLLLREGKIDDEATAIVVRLVASRRKHAPTVRRISARVSPMLFGVGRMTCIVCPNRLWDQLTSVQREAFLAHEVAHFLRRDHWVRWLEWSVTAVYWWCPLVYLARQQLERHEEAACDAWAVSRLNAQKRAYAETLLNVVDFLSENRVGVPRLASRMQATDSLEERLRLIMSAGSKSALSPARSWAFLVAGLALLLIHPLPISVAATVKSRPAVESQIEVVSSAKIELPSNSSELPLQPLISLPPVPRGWWNESPARTWADVRMGDHDLKLLAEAGVGVSLFQGNYSKHVFDSQSVRAIAYVASSGRLVIGNANGELHLWDVGSSKAVSLIGRHADYITSIAYHPKSGLVSGDAAGNLMSWDIQSGQIRASASVGGPVCSVRWAARGDRLAIVVGDWMDTEVSARLLMVDGSSLEISQSLEIPHNVALAQQHAQIGWLAIEWSGKILSLVTGKVVGIVPKESVSGIMLCQDILERIELLAIRPLSEDGSE